jgi:Fic family protein
MNNLQLVKTDLLPEYLKTIGGLDEKFQLLKDAEISTETFSFYTSVASVFSSKIEGETIEIDSYIKHKGMGMAFQPDYTQKIDDLYNAYLFAQKNELNQKNIAQAHILLVKNIVATNYQGKLRNNNIYVATDDGRIEYVAISHYQLQAEMEKFYIDLIILLNQKLKTEEVFYYAAYLHLVFVKIHPWHDGNGRTARLLEKWFVAQHLGEKAWFLQSEKNYYLHHQTYYKNLRALGLEYQELDFTKALPFLLMLPNALQLMEEN